MVTDYYCDYRLLSLDWVAAGRTFVFVFVYLRWSIYILSMVPSAVKASRFMKTRNNNHMYLAPLNLFVGSSKIPIHIVLASILIRNTYLFCFATNIHERTDELYGYQIVIRIRSCTRMCVIEWVKTKTSVFSHDPLIVFVLYRDIFSVNKHYTH